jgi:hypothetical protein
MGLTTGRHDVCTKGVKASVESIKAVNSAMHSNRDDARFVMVTTKSVKIERKSYTKI